MALTIDQILSADDLPRVRVDVPEWATPGTNPDDSFVFVRVMTGEELDQYDESLNKNSDGEKLVSLKGLRVTTVCLTMCDEHGNRIAMESQVAALGKKSGVAIKRVFAKAQEINELSKAASEKLEKN